MKKNRIFFIISVLVALMLACNITIGDTTAPTAASSTPIIIVVTQVVPATDIPAEEPTKEPTPTDGPTDTPAVVATSTASVPVVTPLKDPVNCRYGPSIFWEQIYALEVGAYMPVVGKSADGGWWLVGIPNSDNKTCWVGKSVTVVTGDVSKIAVVAAPEAFISDVNLRIRPNSVNAGVGCVNPPSTPFTLTGNIATNGPLEIRWYIETEQGGRQAEKSIKFDRFGVHPVSFTFVPPVWEKGNFWIRIVVTRPKSFASDVTYEVRCQ